MSHSRRTLSLVTVVLIFVLLAAGVVWRVIGGDLLGVEQDEIVAPSASALPEGEVPAPQFSATVAQPVGGAEVLRDTLWIRVTAAGQAEAHRRTTLAAQVDGVVRGIPVRENDAVRSGAVLVQIDTTEHALGVAQARADLLAAQTDYRQQILFDDAIEDRTIREERERIARSRSGLDQAEVRLRQAELQLARTMVSAPFAGRIADLGVVEGQHVTMATELMTVVDLDPIKVEVQVLEAELIKN